jgi:hypothetical protein
VANDQQRRDFITLNSRFETTKSELLKYFIKKIIILGRPLSVSVAYSGRIAVAYKNGRSFKGKFIRNSKKSEADTRYFDLVVSIYECESTGGKKSTKVLNGMLLNTRANAVNSHNFSFSRF